MKRLLKCTLALILFLTSFSLYGCGKDKKEVIYLNVYNCEDYICLDDPNVLEEFENYYKETYGKTVVVNYSTFGTLENMYNELQLSKTKKEGGFEYAYDLVCPSDYMFQKLYRENMLEPYDFTIPEGEEGSLYNYTENVSHYVKNLFDNSYFGDSTVSWSRYAVPYMYGTMGFVYNPEVLANNGDYKEGDENHWTLPWNSYSKNLGTIKDSIRDTYCLALGYVYQDELAELAERYQNGEITAENYNKTVTEIFNRVDKDTVEKVTEALSVLKENVYGFEVDSGKGDMATGKIAINFAWSGDAVYVLDTAEEDGTILYYAVPEEGSNVWFDAWVMPKGANKIVAQEFVNFISSPENACNNMNYIGYTPAIGGEEVYNQCVDWYGEWILLEEEDGEYEFDGLSGKYNEYYFGELTEEQKNSVKNADGTYNLIIPEYDDEGEITGYYLEENVEMIEYDVSYLLQTPSDYANSVEYTVFISSDNENRQLYTQYPTKEILDRCAIMRDFKDEEMKLLNDMWDEVKVSAVPSWLMILIVSVIVLVAVSIPVLSYLRKKGIVIRIEKKHKNLTLVKREILK